MASNRHLGRIVALQTLYEYEFRREVGDETVEYKDILERNLDKYKSSVDDVDFVDKLVSWMSSYVRWLPNGQLSRSRGLTEQFCG